MSRSAAARGALLLTAIALIVAVPAIANDAAHKMAEKFAGASDDSQAKKSDGKPKAADNNKRAGEKAGTSAKGSAAAKPAQDKARGPDKVEAPQKSEAEQKAEAAKREAQRKAADAKRRAAAQAAAEARRAAEQRQADEADMLARARREAEEMRVAEEVARLTQEARHLIEQAETERTKAEALLKSQATQESASAAEREALARQRQEETRQLAEKLNRVRQIRDARLARLAAQMEDRQGTVLGAPGATSPPTIDAGSPEDKLEQADTPDAQRPPAATDSQAPEPPAAIAEAPPVSTPSRATDTPPAGLAAPEAPARVNPEPPQLPPVRQAERPSEAPPEVPTARHSVHPAAEARVAVLLILEPGNYGIRRGRPKVADPILCTQGGCYVSAGPNQPAVFMPGHKAMGIGNTWGARAGACRGALGCVFRGVELATFPGYLQPVDLHILRHDRRQAQIVHGDSGCRATGARLSCSNGIYSEDYSMWIVPESIAAAAGPTALQRALAEGLNGPRSAQVMPLR